MSLETVLVAVAFPETIKPELRTSTRKLVVENWRVPRTYCRHEAHARPAERSEGPQSTEDSFLIAVMSKVIQPWNNLRVFATHELRLLMSIRTMGYVPFGFKLSVVMWLCWDSHRAGLDLRIAAGGGSVYMSFYQRFEFDTFTILGDERDFFLVLDAFDAKDDDAHRSGRGCHVVDHLGCAKTGGLPWGHARCLDPFNCALPSGCSA